MSERMLARGRLRIVVGLAISAVFIVLTLSRVDLANLAVATSRVQPIGLLAAVLLVGVEVALRARRWQLLLGPIRPTPYRSAAAYLCIGYLANSLLPARLGDLARAYLAGGAFRVGRVGVLGTIVVERLADGGFILVSVAILGLAVAGGGSMAATALGIGGTAILGLSGVLVALWLGRRAGVHESEVGRRLWEWWGRLAIGARALRDPRGLVTVGALTVVAFGLAVAMFLVVARACGVELTPSQAALAMGGVALSLSIPAAPGSLGTYEFVGVTILATFGIAAEPALVTILLVHLCATIPSATAGLLVSWRLDFRVASLTPTTAGTAGPGPRTADVDVA